MISSAQTSKSLIMGNTVSQMVISLFLGGSLSFLVSVVDQLQLIIHLPILNIEIPANGMEFFSLAVPIVTYDVLENIELYNNFI